MYATGSVFYLCDLNRDSIHPPILVPDSASVTRSPTSSIPIYLTDLLWRRGEEGIEIGSYEGGFQYVIISFR
jgi:hypothetical protein